MLTLTNNTISNNSAYSFGSAGGAHIISPDVFAADTLNMTGNTFTGNSAFASPLSTLGGGFHVSEVRNVTLVANTISGNSSDSVGGGSLDGTTVFLRRRDPSLCHSSDSER